MNNLQLDEYTTIVDAVFGIGLSREVTGKYREFFEAINQSKIPVLAVDIPSGVRGDTGKVFGSAVRAGDSYFCLWKNRALSVSWCRLRRKGARAGYWYLQI